MDCEDSPLYTFILPFFKQVSHLTDRRGRPSAMDLYCIGDPTVSGAGLAVHGAASYVFYTYSIKRLQSPIDQGANHTSTMAKGCTGRSD